jgi:hypothetical protein
MAIDCSPLDDSEIFLGLIAEFLLFSVSFFVFELVVAAGGS